MKTKFKKKEKEASSPARPDTPMNAAYMFGLPTIGVFLTIGAIIMGEALDDTFFIVAAIPMGVMSLLMYLVAFMWVVGRKR